MSYVTGKIKKKIIPIIIFLKIVPAFAYLVFVNKLSIKTQKVINYMIFK